jgi:hypothetical protein
VKVMRILLCVALLLAAAGCGGQGEGEAAPSSLPSVTRSVTRTPVQPSGTRSAAGPTASPPTRSGRPQRTSQAPKPSRVEPTPEPSGVEPTRTTSAGAVPAEPSPTSAGAVTTINSPSPTSSATQSDAAATTDEEGAVAPWVWWAVGLLAVTALIAAAVLFRRRRARVEWAAGLDETLAEVTWLSTDLIPTLLGESPAGRPGVWAIGRPRVLGLEQMLAGLVGRAPDDVTARHCTALSSTVQALRRVLDQPENAAVVGAEASATAIRQVQRQLDQGVVALQGRSGAGHSS